MLLLVSKDSHLDRLSEGTCNEVTGVVLYLPLSTGQSEYFFFFLSRERGPRTEIEGGRALKSAMVNSKRGERAANRY